MGVLAGVKPEKLPSFLSALAALQDSEKKSVAAALTPPKIALSIISEKKGEKSKELLC